MRNFFKTESIMRFVAKYWLILLVSQVAIVFGAGYLVHAQIKSDGHPGESQAIEEVDEDDSEAAQKWTCSMHPQIQKDGPGSCPLCGMDLVPVSGGKGKKTSLRQLTISPAARALMNIQVSPVENRYVEAEVRMFAKVDYDETRLKYITARVSGRLDRLFVDFTGVSVQKGDHLASIYSEELYRAQEELIIQVRAARERKGKKSLYESGIDYLGDAREKLRLWGMTPEQISAIEKREKPSDHMTLFSPMGGIVIEKYRKEGDRVNIGDRIYAVADLSHVWVMIDAYESDLQWIRYGQNVSFTTDAYPGETFPGKIAFIDPILHDMSRTVKVRVNVPNKKGKLKPEMFVRATVRAKVAAGGRVMDPSLAGKWVSPMHPEIVKDGPGACDICGMPLVPAEKLGYVSLQSGESFKPMVIPKSAVLVTGTRAIVYVQMSNLPHRFEDDYRKVAGAMEHEDLIEIRDAFSAFEKAVAKPNKLLVTSYAKGLWKEFAAELRADAAKGRVAESMDEAQIAFDGLVKTVDRIREDFSPPDQPTFVGREIVLGPRARGYYIVKHGLHEGELVVTRGNFKIDSEIQIQAKPSMMTPEGGGGGGHDHGGNKAKKKAKNAGGGGMDVPVGVRQKLQRLNASFKEVAKAVKNGEPEQIHEKYKAFSKVLESVEADDMSGHAKMMWKELAMRLGNDAFEGSEVTQLAEVQRVFQGFQSNMSRLDSQFGLSHAGHDAPQRLEVPSEFQRQLVVVWQAYLAIGDALAGDDPVKAKQAVANVESALAAVDMKLLTEARAHTTWMKALANLKKTRKEMAEAGDLESLREQFESLSGEMQVLALTFGFGKGVPVYQLHCEMAFDKKGAFWLQKDDQTRNPYFGAGMLKCAQRVDLIAGGKAGSGDHKHDAEGHKHE